MIEAERSFGKGLAVLRPSVHSIFNSWFPVMSAVASVSTIKFVVQVLEKCMHRPQNNEMDMNLLRNHILSCFRLLRKVLTLG